MRSRQLTFPKPSSFIKTAFYIGLCYTMMSCKSRSQNSNLDSAILEESKQLTTIEGDRVERRILDLNIQAAAYIGRVDFFNGENSRSANSSFFEHQSLKEILNSLPDDQSPKSTSSRFTLVGCKKTPLRAFWQSMTDLMKLRPNWNDFLQNYEEYLKPSKLSEEIDAACVRDLKIKERHITFEFLIQRRDPNTADELSNYEQILILSSPNPTLRPAIFKATQALPKGNLLVVYRSNSYGKSAPQAAILPSDKDFDSSKQEEALYAMGWTQDWLRTMRQENPVLSNIFKTPTNLYETSARFHSASSLAKAGNNLMTGAAAASIPLGLWHFSASTPLVLQAYQVLFSGGLSFEAALGALGATLAPATGLAATAKGWCDLSRINARLQLEPENRVLKNRAKICLMSNIVFGIATVSSAFLSAPQIKDFARDTMRRSFELVAEADARQVLDIGSIDQIENYRKLLEEKLQLFDQVYKNIQLGYVNAAAVNAFRMRTLYDLTERAKTLRELPGKILDAQKSITEFIGVPYGSEFKGALLASRCPTHVDLFPLFLGYNGFIKSLIPWQRCLEFMRKVWPKMVENEDFWKVELTIAREKMLDSMNSGDRSTTYPNLNLNTDELTPQKLKEHITGSNGPLFTKLPNDWNDERGYSRMVANLEEDLLACSKNLLAEPNSCSNDKKCMHQCASSTLDKFRREKWHLPYFTCLSYTQVEREKLGLPKICIIHHSATLSRADPAENGINEQLQQQ